MTTLDEEFQLLFPNIKMCVCGKHTFFVKETYTSSFVLNVFKDNMEIIDGDPIFLSQEYQDPTLKIRCSCGRIWNDISCAFEFPDEFLVINSRKI